MHAPLIEPSGFEERKWSEQKRISNEKQIGNVLERAADLGENIPVVLHGANVFGQQWEKDLKTMGGKEALRAMAVVNEETGETNILPYEKKRKIMSEEERKHYQEIYKLKEPPKEIIWDPMRRLEALNRTQWQKEVLELFKYQKDIDELSERMDKKWMENKVMADSGSIKIPANQERAQRNQRDIMALQGHITELNQNFSSHFDEIINRVEKFSDKESKDKNVESIKKMEEEYEKKEREFQEKYKNEARKALEPLKNIGDEKLREDLERNAINNLSLLKSKFDVEKEKILLSHLQMIKAPEIWKPVKYFAIEKASETVAGAAFDTYKKFGKKAPVIAVENSYPEMPLSRAEDLKKGIKLAREKFAEKLTKEKGMSKDEADETANKLIGATWDIGHINLLRRAGYSEKEVKELVIKETEKIGSLVKHVHITDNFGFNDTRLPAGMGNVPIKDILETLEKEGWKGRGIIEAGNFVKEFETSPFPTVLEYFGSPVYETGGRFKSDIYGSSFGSYIDFPKQHFDLYGSGFSTLPKELGGEIGGGEKGRFMQGESE